MIADASRRVLKRAEGGGHVLWASTLALMGELSAVAATVVNVTVDEVRGRMSAGVLAVGTTQIST